MKQLYTYGWFGDSFQNKIPPLGLTLPGPQWTALQNFLRVPESQTTLIGR